MGRKTTVWAFQEKLITMSKALHPIDTEDRLYVPRKEGGRGLASIQDSVDASIQRLEDYIKKPTETIQTTQASTEGKWLEKKKWEEKLLYGHFKRQTSKISHEKTWTWLRNRNLERETESLLIAAQNDAIRTNYVKLRIDQTQQNSRCRLFSDRDETLNHIISECGKLAESECDNTHLCSSLDKLLTPRRELMCGRIEWEADSQGKEQKHNNFVVKTPREDGDRVTLCG